MKLCKYIELHLHLDGAIRINTLYELAKETKLYENLSLEEFSDSVSIGNKKYFDSLTHCLTLFNNVLSLISGNKEYLERIAYEICEDQYNNNVLYTEIRYNPHILKGDIETLDEVVEIINNGIKRAIDKYGIHVNSILCCLRSKPCWSFDIARLCIKYRNKGVVGMDIAGDEKNYSDHYHKDAFKFANHHGINITAHAGECCGAENISSALNKLYAKRIGHCYSCINQPYLMGYLKRKNIHIECCYTSSIKTRSVDDTKSHPIKTFYKRGLSFSINTDDPSIFNINYLDEVKTVKEELKITNNEIYQIMIKSLDAAFASTEEKKRIKEKLTKSWAKQIQDDIYEKLTTIDL